MSRAVVTKDSRAGRYSVNVKIGGTWFVVATSPRHITAQQVAREVNNGDYKIDPALLVPEDDVREDGSSVLRFLKKAGKPVGLGPIKKNVAEATRATMLYLVEKKVVERVMRKDADARNFSYRYAPPGVLPRGDFSRVAMEHLRCARGTYTVRRLYAYMGIVVPPNAFSILEALEGAGLIKITRRNAVTDCLVETAEK